MNNQVLRILNTGLGASLQDLGRAGYASFGVPPGGAMDDHAALWANRLLDNPPHAPVLELLLQGAQLEVLNAAWFAITGADANCNFPLWRVVNAHAGDKIKFHESRRGIWMYVAVEGGFQAPRWFGSASVYPRGGIGRAAAPGDVLERSASIRFALPKRVAGRIAAVDERHNYSHPPPLRVWPGPQWDQFSANDRALLFDRSWTVSSQSDRVGYRLTGASLTASQLEILSEPVLVGTIQVPPSGQPIVTMRDGPTVGGYPKIGLIDPHDLSWLTQCRPGTPVRFSPASGMEHLP